MQSPDQDVADESQQWNGSGVDSHAKETADQESGEHIPKNGDACTGDDPCRSTGEGGGSLSHTASRWSSAGRGLSPLIREGRLVLKQPLSASPRARPLHPASAVGRLQARSVPPSEWPPALNLSASQGPQVLSRSTPNLLPSLNLSLGSVIGEATCPGCGALFEVSLSESEPNSPLLDPNSLSFEYQTPSDTPIVDPNVRQGASWSSSPRRLVAITAETPITHSSTPSTSCTDGSERVAEKWTSASLLERFKQHVSPLKVILKSTPAPARAKEEAASHVGLDIPASPLEQGQDKAGWGRDALGQGKMTSPRNGVGAMATSADADPQQKTHVKVPGGTSAQTLHQVLFDTPDLQMEKGPAGEPGADELDQQYQYGKDERDELGDGKPTEKCTSRIEKPGGSMNRLENHDLQNVGAMAKDQVSGWEDEDDAKSQGFVPAPETEAGWEEQNLDEDVGDQEKPQSLTEEGTVGTGDQPIPMEEMFRKELEENWDDEIRDDYGYLDQSAQSLDYQELEDSEQEGWRPADLDQDSAERKWCTPPLAGQSGRAASRALASDKKWKDDEYFQPEDNDLKRSLIDWSKTCADKTEECHNGKQTQEDEMAAQDKILDEQGGLASEDFQDAGEADAHNGTGEDLDMLSMISLDGERLCEEEWTRPTPQRGWQPMESWNEPDRDAQEEGNEEPEQFDEDIKEDYQDELPDYLSRDPEEQSPIDWDRHSEIKDGLEGEELQPQRDDNHETPEVHNRAQWGETWREPYFSKSEMSPALAEGAASGLEGQQTWGEPSEDEPPEDEQDVQEDEGRQIQKSYQDSLSCSEGKATFNQGAPNAGNVQGSGSSQDEGLQAVEGSAADKRVFRGLHRDKQSPACEPTSLPWTNLSGGEDPPSDSVTSRARESPSLEQHPKSRIACTEVVEGSQVKRKQLPLRGILKHTHHSSQHLHFPSAQGNHECSFCQGLVEDDEEVREKGDPQPLIHEVEETAYEESDNELSEAESISDAETVRENLSPRPLSSKGIHRSLRTGADAARKPSPAACKRDQGSAGDVRREEDAGKRCLDAGVSGKKTTRAPAPRKDQKLLSCRDILQCIATRGRPRDPWPCLLCDEKCTSTLQWQEHIRSCHAVDEATASKDFEWQVVYEALKEMHPAKVGIQRCYLCNKFWEPRSSAVLSHILLSHLAPLAPDLCSKIRRMFQEGTNVDVPRDPGREQHCRYCRFISPSVFHAAEHFERSHFVVCFEQYVGSMSA